MVKPREMRAAATGRTAGRAGSGGPRPGGSGRRRARAGLAALIVAALCGCFDATQPILTGADPETAILSMERSAATHVNDEGVVAGWMDDPLRAFLWKDGWLRTLPEEVAPGVRQHRSILYDLDDEGWAAGWLDVRGGEGRAFVWNGAEWRLLPSPEGASAGARALNGDGLVAGWYSPRSSARLRPALWRDGAFEAIELPPPGVGRGLDVNERGDVLFGEADRDDPGRAWRLDAGGGLAPVVGPGSVVLVGAHLLEDGRVVGGALLEGDSCFGTGGRCVPFVWSEGSARALPTLDGGSGRVVGVADDGTVYGASSTAEGEPMAVAWRDGGAPEPLGHFGDGASWPRAVNGRGDLVGGSTLAGVPHGFLWSGGDFLFLDTRGRPGSLARDVNEAGWVVGHTGVESTDGIHAVLWRPRR